VNEFIDGWYYNVSNGGGKKGPSPIIVDYTLDLTLIPDNAIITCAQAVYQFSGLPPITYEITDTGRSNSPTNVLIWRIHGIGYLNSYIGRPAAERAAVPVRVTAWYSALEEKTFGINHFEVWYTEPVSG
jgi:hypothetical protein